LTEKAAIRPNGRADRTVITPATTHGSAFTGRKETVKLMSIRMRPPPRIRVLVVEEDPPLRELDRQQLLQGGHAVVTVGDGLDAAQTHR